MKIARHWTKREARARLPSGESISVSAWGWSAESEEEARQRADLAARRAARRLESGERSARGYYSDRPPREEIVEEIAGGDGATAAVVTRNAYGALVLNTRDLMFIDVDVPHEWAGGRLVRAVKRLFGSPEDDHETTVRKRIEEAARARGEYAFRLYRTRAGFRCAVVNRPISPGTPESQRLLEEFGADPLYVRLCRNQQSYRARLTPKFWRCGARRPPKRFPWDTEAEEQTYRAWEREYEARSRSFATCRLVARFGAHEADAELEKLMSLHDRLTKSDSQLELA